MLIPADHLDLLEECSEMFGRTHSDEGDLWDELEEAVVTRLHYNSLQLLKDCKYHLDNTHCYDTEIYHKLNEIV